MKIIKFLIISILLLLKVDVIFAEITIEKCQDAARENYPLIRQYDLINRTKDYNLANANKNYLPQLSLSGKASYQSDVTELPISVPGIQVDPLSKDQYQAYLQINQTIWDGGVTGSIKKTAKASALVDTAKIEIEMYLLKDRVNQLYFGILLIRDQKKQVNILLDELGVNRKRIESYMQNGIANQSDVDAVKVEELGAAKQMAELTARENAYINAMALVTGQTISINAEFVMPDASHYDAGLDANERPEINFFEARKILHDSKKSAIVANTMPKVGAFLQGGYGRPALNMLKNNFDPYYIAGVQATWNFGTYYTLNNELNKIKAEKQSLDAERDTFEFNNNLQIISQLGEIKRLESLMENDDEIIALRSAIKKAAQVKLENGTISVSDLLREINNENMAMQDRALHAIQLLSAKYSLMILKNN
jgi:outer membrane protein TolC